MHLEQAYQILHEYLSKPVSYKPLNRNVKFAQVCVKGLMQHNELMNLYFLTWTGSMLNISPVSSLMFKHIKKLCDICYVWEPFKRENLKSG